MKTSDFKVGSRVGAIAEQNEEGTLFFGYGVYEGDFKIEDPTIYMMGFQVASMDIINPRIRLDNGDVVWGCESWWAPEEEVQQLLEDEKVEIISVAEYRKQCAEAAEDEKNE